ncbi:MAG: major capsid protein [Methylobacter sp.]|jgi:hypothetical protein|uniref:hypothetical protein n=1 Tax=Methylobacter sp. TaxID=2051955 RepID=UPI0025F50E70|nr:hypothetical protein [Methylobacter sp.]MCK9622615.1 major capsid protein [Methylobacter sp.]
MALNFLTPYQVAPILEGVIKGLEPVRPNWLQSFFGAPKFSENTRINLDKEYNVKNVMGQFAAPNVDVSPIVLPDYGTKEFYFSYSKESIDSDDFDTINQRQIGQEFGQVNPLANKAARLQRKMILAEQRFENLFEKTAADILLYGGYQASGEYHPTVRYDFQKTVITSNTALAANKLVPAVNLTTTAVTLPWDSSTTYLPVLPTNGGFTAGDKAWTKANVDAAKATPVKDFIKMVESTKIRSNVSAFMMSDDAYEIFQYDLNKNYGTASDTTLLALLKVGQDILPRIQEYRGLTYRRSYPVNDTGEVIGIYTYNAVYNNRTSGAETAYIGSGWVVALPPASSGLKVYGRIMHPKANYSAMPRWINYWMNDKTGIEEYEYHTNFVMAHLDIDAITTWKVI